MSTLFKYISFLSFGVIVFYITPLFFGISHWKMDNIFPEVIYDYDYQASLIRTIVFALLSTFVIVTLSFCAGYVLRKLNNHKSLLIGSILLLPFLLGSVSTSFLFKMILLNSDLLYKAFNHTAVLFLILAIIQFWQFGTLFTYVFWLNNLGIKKDITDYSNYYKLGRWEKIKNIFLPYHRNLIVLLSIFFFVTNIYESTKLQIIFRASKGTNSELISNTLYNAYLSDSKISPDFAANILFSQSALFYIPLFIALTIVLYFIVNFVILSLSKSKFALPSISIGFKNSSENIAANILLWFLSFSVLTPILYVFYKQGIGFYNLKYLISTIGLSFVASAILLVVLTLPFSYYLRIRWRHSFHEINSRSLWVFITLFLLFLIPPLALMLFGFEWSSLFGIRGLLPTYISWIIGQCISALPIIASFVFVIHFFIKNKELEYLSIMKVNFSEIVRWSFMRRFRIEYVMTFLFSFSIIWNEGTFNKVYSDRIPSYVSEILRTVNSRNADYSQGMMFFLFSLILGIFCIVLWNIIVARLANFNTNS